MITHLGYGNWNFLGEEVDEPIHPKFINEITINKTTYTTVKKTRLYQSDQYLDFNKKEFTIAKPKQCSRCNTTYKTQQNTFRCPFCFFITENCNPDWKI